jgi:hypothetical protein
MPAALVAVEVIHHGAMAERVVQAGAEPEEMAQAVEPVELV